MAKPLGGGFVTFPGASLAPDPSASGLLTPFGAAWVSYDAHRQRWLPARREMISPDGATWLYGTFRQGNEYHAVDVRTGVDTTLWGADQLFRVIGLDNTSAYALLDSSQGAHLWELPLDGSAGKQLSVTGTWEAISGGAAWGTGSATLPPGAPYSLQRLDLQRMTMTAWLQVLGEARMVGFDAAGAPILQAGGAGGDVIVAPAPGVQQLVAKGFAFAREPSGASLLPAIGDAHGIWLAGLDGIYFSVGGAANKQSSVQAFPAGPCQ